MRECQKPDITEDCQMSQTYLPVVGDGFEHYMAQVNRFDLLTAEEEYALAVRLQRDGDLEAAHRLVCANLRFVVKVAMEYRGYGLRLPDLVQEGNIGLMQAVRKFDPERGLRLITYAVWWIRATIQSYIMKSWSLVKIGTTQAQKKLFYKLAQTRKALRDLTGSESLADVADELEVSEAAVEEMAQRLGQRDLSLDVELNEGDDYTLLDILPDRRANQETTLISREERRLLGERTQAALASPPRPRTADHRAAHPRRDAPHPAGACRRVRHQPRTRAPARAECPAPAERRRWPRRRRGARRAPLERAQPVDPGARPCAPT